MKKPAGEAHKEQGVREAAPPSLSRAPDRAAQQGSFGRSEDGGRRTSGRTGLQTVRIYAYGVARNRLSQAIRRLGVPALIVDQPGDADVLVTLRAYYRKRQRTIVDAENRGVPIYVLRANTLNQMQQFLSDLFNLYAEAGGESGMDAVVQETRAAIDAVMNGEGWIELKPAASALP